MQGTLRLNISGNKRCFIYLSQLYEKTQRAFLVIEGRIGFRLK